MQLDQTKNIVKKKKKNNLLIFKMINIQWLFFAQKEKWCAAKAFHSTVLHLILSWEHLGILMCNRCRIKCKIFISPSFYLLTAQESKICGLESTYLWSISIIFVPDKSLNRGVVNVTLLLTTDRLNQVRQSSLASNQI